MHKSKMYEVDKRLGNFAKPIGCIGSVRVFHIAMLLLLCNIFSCTSWFVQAKICRRRCTTPQSIHQNALFNFSCGISPGFMPFRLLSR